MIHILMAVCPPIALVPFILMWKTRLAWGLGILGAVAGAFAPIINEAEQSGASGSNDASISIIDGVIGGGIWALIGFGIGSLIDRARRNRRQGPT